MRSNPWPGVIAAVLVLGLGACARPAGPHAGVMADPVVQFPRSLVSKQVVQTAVDYEKALSLRYEVPPGEGQESFVVLPGKSRVLITAPHATLPHRDNGDHAFTDGGTGSLASALHDLADCTVIVTSCAQPSDPNFSDANGFKEAVAKAVATGRYDLVLDIHGSHPWQGYDVDFGTMHGESLLGQSSVLTSLAAALREQGLQDLSQDYFPAAKQATVTKWVSTSCKPPRPCVQLEISSTCLLAAHEGKFVGSDQQAHRFGQVLESLVNFVKRWDADHAGH